MAATHSDSWKLRQTNTFGGRQIPSPQQHNYRLVLAHLKVKHSYKFNMIKNKFISFNFKRISPLF